MLFGGLAGRTTGAAEVFLSYLGLFGALVLAGYVTGHLVGRPQLVWATLVGIIYILLTATLQATRDAIVAYESGIAALPPLDLLQLTISDVLVLTGAVFGGWLADRFQIST